MPKSRKVSPKVNKKIEKNTSKPIIISTKKLSEKSSSFILGWIFFFFFLILTPLDKFDPEIPKDFHTGFFSIIRFDRLADDGGHYAYLPSLFLNHDLNFGDDPYGVNAPINQTTGYICNYWPVGSALIWSPFFFLGYFFSEIFHFFGMDFAQQGYSYPVISITGLGTLVYSFAGLLFSYKTLQFFFRRTIAFIVTITVFFSTILVHYVYIRPFMDIALEFFGLSILIYLFALIAYKRIFSLTTFLFAGILCGLISITRFNGILHVLCMALFFLREFYFCFVKKDRQWYGIIWQILFFLVGLATTLMPQILVQYLLNGSPFDPGPSYAANVGDITWNGYLANLKALFVGNIGILLQNPICIIGIAGYLYALYHPSSSNRKFFYITLLSLLVLQILLAARLNHFGNTYGVKFLASSLMLWAFGVGEIFQLIKWRSVLYLLAILLIAWQYIQLLQFSIIVSYDQFSVYTVIKNFILILDQHPKFLWRSSNFFHLITSYGYPLNSLTNVWFLVFLPSFLIISILLLTTYIQSIQKAFRNYVLTYVFLSLLILVSLLIGTIPKKSSGQVTQFIQNYEKKKPLHDQLMQVEYILTDYSLGIKEKDQIYNNIISSKTEAFKNLGITE